MGGRPGWRQFKEDAKEVSRGEEKRSEWNENRITSAIYKEKRNRKRETDREEF